MTRRVLVLLCGLGLAIGTFSSFDPRNAVAGAPERALDSHTDAYSSADRSARSPGGIVRVENGVLVDDGGPFWAVGATYMAAAWFFKFDRARLERNLGYLAAGGVRYIRVLGEVGGEFWTGRETDPRWPDYDQVIAGLTDLAYDRYGLRVEWTLFGSVHVSSTPQLRAALVDRFAAMAAARPERIQHFEIANEAWKNGFGGDAGRAELRALTQRLQQRLRSRGLPIPVAPSSPAGQECSAWLGLYEGLGADLATLHFSRDISGPEGAWRPVRMPWGYHQCQGMPPVASNNEPIGPLSSVEEDTDPLRIVSAAAVTFVARLPLYVLHSRAGVRGDLDFDALPHAQQTFDGLRALQRLAPRDLPAGRPLDHSSLDAPLVLLSPLWPWSGDEAGLVGAFTSVARDGFSLIAIGIRDHASFRAARAMNVEVFDLLSGERMQQEPAAVGDPVLLGGRPAVFVRGTWR